MREESADKATRFEIPDVGYPVALRVRDRLCVIVGGGAVGTRKAEDLVKVGARVRVVAPEVTTRMQTLVQDGHIERIASDFAAENLDGAFLVVVATSDPDVNRQVWEAARVRNLLVNHAGTTTDGSTGDFETMATVRRGGLQIAVTTSGASPALAARIAKTIAGMWGEEWTAWIQFLWQWRQEARQRVTDVTLRAEFLRSLAARDDLQQQVAQAENAATWNEAERMLTEMTNAYYAQTERSTACPGQ